MDNIQFVNELAKLRPSSTFLSLFSYRNEFSEIADYNLIFHISYESALKRSLLALETVIPVDDLESQAKKELVDSFQKSLVKSESIPVEEIDDAYTRFFDDDGKHIKGVKLHTDTNTLHLYGLVQYKRVLMPGNYPTKNRRALTIAKDKLRSLCSVSKFRQFKITPAQVDRISVEHLSLLPPA